MSRIRQLEAIARLRALEALTREASEQARPRFEQRGQLLPRERIEHLLDPGAPSLELSTLAGWCVDRPDPARSIPGGGMISLIGSIAGVRCMIIASDAGIEAGAIQASGLKKLLRAQQIALQNRLPFVHLVESAGANLLEYRVEQFVEGGEIFCNLARLSAAGIPVMTVVHGSSTAGGAYMPGLSDVVIMVRGRARAFLAGPPLLKAATGEIATEEELGGAALHAEVTGLADRIAEDDAEALALLRSFIGQLDGFGGSSVHPPAAHPPYASHHAPAQPPSREADTLLDLMPADHRSAVDMREVIACLIDGGTWLDFKPDHGRSTVCGSGRLAGHAVGILSNNGPIDPDGATKATHFIQWCDQTGQPLLFLQNTTGFLVGSAPERAGMIKHGSKMIQAVSNARVPAITLHCGASFGAGNYGMCGRGFGPRFVFSWPCARTAVMGAEQAALTMRIVAEATARRRGEPPDEAALAAREQAILENFERQSGAFFTSARLLDDGVIDPRDTRPLLTLLLDIITAAEQRRLRPNVYGVARP